MKQSVKIIVDSIEKEIQSIITEVEEQDYVLEKDFEFGTFTYDVSFNESSSSYSEPWEFSDIFIRIEVKSVSVTNENSKVLTNLSTEVFNQLETTYTNY